MGGDDEQAEVKHYYNHLRRREVYAASVQTEVGRIKF